MLDLYVRKAERLTVGGAQSIKSQKLDGILQRI